MFLIGQVRRTFSLIHKRNRLKFVLLTLLQASLGFMDLLAIIITGVFGYVGSAYLNISTLSPTVIRYLDLVGLPVHDLGRTLVYLISVAVILMVGKSIFALLILKRTYRFLANRSAEISKILANRFMHSSQNVINSVSSQEATYAVSNGANTTEILGASTVIISEVFMLTLLSIFIIISDPILAVTLFLYFALLYGLTQRKLGRWTRDNSKIIAESGVGSAQTFQDGIALYKELFIANKLSFVVDGFSVFRSRIANSIANNQIVAYIPKFTFESALIVGTCLVGLEQVLLSSTSNAVATLIMFLTAGSRILPSLLRLQSASNSIQSGSGGADITFRLIKAMDEDVTNRKQFDLIPVSDKPFTPEVVISNLEFNYLNRENFAIKNLSLFVPEGTSLAIVGRTGSGKSTLVDLILGILEPKTGSITVGGVDPYTAIHSWPGAIGYVPQSVAFINGNVRENVAIGSDPKTSNDELIWACLRMAQLESLFKETGEGLETLIGERGIRLSGGQRQRLGIARALYSQPSLLILDEATSSLDAETEKAVAETIQNLSHKVTMIVIAHRIATVKELDQVIYLEDGALISKGTFNEVRVAVPQFERQAKLLGL